MRSRLGLVAAIFCIGLTACGSPDAVRLPAALIGTWTTNNPDYEGRFFTLTPDRITLGVGDGVTESYRIVAVRETRDKEGLLYTMEYADQAQGSHSMAFYFDAGGGGTVRLKNQLQMRWRKSRR
jgi:hypothetical protein